MESVVPVFLQGQGRERLIPSWRGPGGRRGVFLVELIVSIAIIGTSFLIILEVHGNTMVAAVNANNLRVARLLAQGKLGEIEAKGFRPEDQVFPESGDFGDLGRETGHPAWRLVEYELEYEYVNVSPERTEEELATYLEEHPDDEDGLSKALKVTMHVRFPRSEAEEYGQFTMTTFLVEYERKKQSSTTAAAPEAAGAAGATGGGTGGTTPPGQ